MLKARVDSYLLNFASGLAIFFPFSVMLGNAYADITFSLLAVLFLFRSFLMRDFAWLRMDWVKLVGVLWAYMLLQSFFAEDVALAFKRTLPWLRFFVGAAALCFWVCRRENVRHWMMVSLSASVIFLVIDGIFQYKLGSNLFGIPSDVLFDGTERLTGVFGEPRLGIVLTYMLFPVLAWMFVSDSGAMRRKHHLLLAGFFTLLSCLVIFLTGERMALLLCGLGLLLMMWWLPLPRSIKLAVLAFGFVIISTASYLAPEKMERQLMSSIAIVESFPDSPYGKLWQSGISVGNSHPVFGVGAQHFREHCPEIYGHAPEVVSVSCNLHPHNIYIEWYAEFGAVGLILFLSFIIAVGRRAVGMFAYLKTQPVFLGLCITLILRLWPLSANTSFFTNWSAIPFWFMMGWFCYYLTLRNDSKRT